MKRNLTRWFVGLQFVSLTLSGCAPTQPFFFGERGELAHYIDRAQQIEYPDLSVPSLPEVTQAHNPITLENQTFEYKDMTLEECISIALVNAHVLHSLPGLQRQNADMASVVLSTPGSQLSTVYDPAIVANTTNSQPLVIDSNGNRVMARGVSRANQVGGVEDALSEFDAQYSSFLSFGNTDRARNVGTGNVFNPQQFRARDGQGQMAISKRMATGGVATVRSQSIYSFNNIPTQAQGFGNFGRAVPSDYTQVLEAQVQHPLMRGRGALVNRIPVVLARINEDISIHRYEERVRNLVRDVEYAYWDLVSAYWNFETAKDALDSAALAYKIAEAKYTTGGSAANQVEQARATYHDFQAQVKSAFSGAGAGSDPGITGRELNLRLLLGWASTDGFLIRPIDKPAIGMAEFDWDAVRTETLIRNLELRTHKWEIKQKELELISSKNSILPDLNLSLAYRWVGVGGRFLDSDGNNPAFPTGGGKASAWEELLGGDYQEGTVRLDFTPNAFGSRRQLADITKSQLELARAHKVLEAKEMAAVNDLSKHFQTLQSLNQQMTEYYQSFVASGELVQHYQNRFALGGDASNQDSVVDQLLRAQERRARSGQMYNRTVAEYNKTLVDLHALKGSLLEYNNIAMEEGVWADKAYWDAHERARERDAAKFLDYGASRPRVISQGEYQQFNGSVHDQTRAARTPANANGQKGPAPEEVPAVPNKQPTDPGLKASRSGSILKS